MAMHLEAAPATGQDLGPLLGPMLRLAHEGIAAAVDAAMRRTDDYLFDRSTQAVEGVELTALRDLRRARSHITQTLLERITLGFAGLRGPAVAAPERTELSLLSEEALEEQLATEQLVESLTRLHATSLELLEQRLAVAAERTALPARENPVGPACIADALRKGLAGVELSTAVRITLCKFIERELGPGLTRLYDRMNAGLSEAGVLPRLLPSLPTVETDRPAANESAPAANVAAQATQAAEPAAATATPTDHALFSSLVGLLQSWRQRGTPAATSGGPAAAPPGQAMGASEMLSVLSLMQSEPPVVLDQAFGDARLSLAEQLRREVLEGARKLGIGAGHPNLSNVQEDAVDLVGMLFEVLLDERDFEPVVRHKIGRLLVPYVKVAIKDRRLFLFKGHPARRLLNAVAEACEGNHGEGPQERELLDRVDALIDRLVAEFNEDVAIFETLEQELRAYLVQHRQRIAIAERRAAEAQRGRERLEQAREQATADIAARVGERSLPPVVGDFVSRVAAHHLSQLHLRDGAESPAYAAALATLDTVVAAHDRAVDGSVADPAADLHAETLGRILASSGCVGQAADEAVEVLRASLRQLANGEPLAAQQPTQLPHAIVPEVPAATPPVLSIVGGTDTLDFDPQLAERIRGLPVGTWLQLAAASGRSEPAKVSWVSPISGRLLFVNRRGIRVLVASAEELAAMAKAGKLQLRQADTAFDDAMHQMVGRLQASAAA